MKKGLAVMIFIALSLVASSCVPSEVVVVSYPQSNGTTETCLENLEDANAGLTILATPTVEGLLDALLDVEAISESTKDTINIILDLLPELEDWLAEIPDETWQAIDEIMGNVTALQTVDATTDALQSLIDSGKYDDYEYLTDALEFGINLLDDGENTIYNPTWDPYADEPLVGFNASQLMKAALEGGIAGAVGAALAEAAPAAYVIGIGGCIGAVDSSIADIISQLAGYW
jgi:hypothetical protein